jgi:hypothetical protein
VAGKPGLKLLTIDQLAARLAGGFLQPINGDDLAEAVAESLVGPLGDLDKIKDLPGFQRAAVSSLSQAWSAGLDLAQEVVAASSPSAKSRLQSMHRLEQGVLARLPKNQLRPRDLVAAALARVAQARALFGKIEILGRTEMSPVWRPLLAGLAPVIETTWIAEARRVPSWLQATGVTAITGSAEQPTIRAISCASPRHEILEALRWARSLLADGVPAEQIAIATASPLNWDDHLLAAAKAANIPIHFIHGRAALDVAEGQTAAALAEILLRGYSMSRVKRLVALLRSQSTAFAELPSAWWSHLPEDAPLLDSAQWKRAIARLAVTDFPDGQDHRALLTSLIETIALGLDQALVIGEKLLQGRALAIWRKALADGPGAALDVTLGGLRLDDGVEPAVSIIWGPASALAAAPRPYVWLVGLTSRAWPRRHGEDPLLPDHVIAADRLDPLPVHQADRRDFETIRAMTGAQLSCSRARRDSGGRINGVSPLFPREGGEVYLAQSREAEQAASPTDRLLARPAEFKNFPGAQSALQTWIDWHSDRLTAHDGLLRPNHPLLRQALERRHSATSMVKLLRDPLSYLWTYGFRWQAPDESEEPLTLDALAFGGLLHEILEETVRSLEDVPSGFAGAAPDRLRAAIDAATLKIAAAWEENSPVPPPVIWRRKQEEAKEMALTALAIAEPPLDGQRSFAEIPFGDDGAKADTAWPAGLPWDPRTPVIIPGTGMRIRGFIDRLDLSGDQSQARVTDYKSGRPYGKAPQLRGGAELQRCLYAYAVRSLIAAQPVVDARLLYPRQDGRVLPLDDPDATLSKLTGFLIAAQTAFMAGKALPGPGADDSFNDLAFALPGGASEGYLEQKSALVAEALADLAPLWEEE